MNFDYKALDPLGNVCEGSVDAPDKDAAYAQLRREGYQIQTLDSAEGGFDLFSRAITRAELIYTTSQLSVMVDTGITLSAALGSIADQEANPSLKSVLADLKSRVETGEDFSASLARYPQHFDKTYLALIRASEQTGQLAEMLDSVANYQRNQLETRQKVTMAMTYPAIMASVAVAVTIFLLTYILPKFAPLFSRKGIKLPLITQWMMTASDSLLHYWWAWLIGIVAVTIAYLYGRRTEAGRLAIDYVMLHLPIIGPTSRKVILSRSIRTLGTMIRSGVSMIDAIKLTKDVSGNVYYEKAWDRVLEGITRGDRIYDGLKGDPLFPPTLLQMISAGEETAKLDSVLAKVSSYYDKEVDAAIKTTTSLLEPAMIVVMGGIVAAIAMGLLLPIFKLSRAGG